MFTYLLLETSSAASQSVVVAQNMYTAAVVSVHSLQQQLQQLQSANELDTDDGV